MTVTTIKERPMLFRGDLVRKILDGSKTMTRRPVNREWGYDGSGVVEDKHGDLIDVLQVCPYGQPGDRLWVRETFALCSKDGVHVSYREDGAEGCHFKKWRPSIHMPRWASRILLEITNVRVERICDIRIPDLEAEGYSGEAGKVLVSFAESWNATYPGSWDRNEWVWVIEFKRVQP